MSTWDKIITDSNKITDLTAPTSTVNINSNTIENISALEATADSNIILEHGADKDIFIKENGVLSTTIGTFAGASNGYGFKIFGNGDENNTEGFVSTLVVNTDSGTKFASFDTTGSTANNFKIEAQGNMQFESATNMVLDSNSGSIELKNTNGTYTPSSAESATTKLYVDTRSIINSMIFG